MTTTRESSTEIVDRYPFGYSTELSSTHESSICTAKRLRQRLQRQQSGQSGRRYTGESSEGSSLVGTPTESGRCFTFTAAQRIHRNGGNNTTTTTSSNNNNNNFSIDDQRKPSMNQNLSEMLLDAIHMDDANLVDRLLLSHCSNKVLSSSPSIGSTNTFTDLAQRRHGATGVGSMQHRRSNASSTLSTHSGGRSNCAAMSTLHMAVAHKQRDIVELLLKSGYDPNMAALCHCKGACTTSGNIPLSSVLPPSRSHSAATPGDICSVCSHLRVVSILDQTPLAIAVRTQSAEMINLLVSYGADVNSVDEDGNSPLMLAVRDSPLSWHCLHMLILFGAKTQQKNSRGICPLDLAPELRKIQETCVEGLFQTACSRPNAASQNASPGALHGTDSSQGHQHGSTAGGSGVAAERTEEREGSGARQQSGGGGPSTQERLMRTAAMISASKQSRKAHLDAESLLLPASFCERGSLSKSPLSPRTSAAPSVSNSSIIESVSVNKDRISVGGGNADSSSASNVPLNAPNRRKSFVSMQLYRRSKLNKDSPLFVNVSREQAWETLQKMSSNPECIEISMRSLHKYCAQQLDDYANPFCGSERDAMDSFLGGLLHQIILTSIADYYQMNTPSQQKWNKRRLVGILVSLVNFCYLCLQKSGTCRQFAALSTLNKIIDAGLVNSLFTNPEVVFHSSRLLNRSHDFHHSYCSGDEDYDELPQKTRHGSDPLQTPTKVTRPSFTQEDKFNRRQTGDSSSAPALILQSFYRKHGVNTASTQPIRLGDLHKAFASIQPSFVIASLHNAITMQNREAGNRSVCSPAHRWRQCYHYSTFAFDSHCTQLLVARLLLFLTGFKEFRLKLSERHQLKTLVNVLEPTLDPQLLCLLLQTIALVALNPSTHRNLIEMQVDDPLIQMLLPADDWYYTNHSTKFGHYVKHHAARILIYIGLGDRVGSRVNLFQEPSDPSVRRSLTGPLPAATTATGTNSSNNNNQSTNEDDYIFETLRTVPVAQEFSRTAMSVEGVLLKILQELQRGPNGAGGGTMGNGAQESIREESPSAVVSPAVPTKSLLPVSHQTNCIIEECEEKPDSPSPVTLSPINGSPAASAVVPSVSDTAPATHSHVSNTLSPSSSFCQLNSSSNLPHRPTKHQQQKTLPQAIKLPLAPPAGTKRSPPSPPCSVNAAVARIFNTLLCISNLEAHLCKFSLVLDSMLLLRILMHKFSWDLCLVAKKRVIGSGGLAVASAAVAGSMAYSSRRAHSSCSLGSSFQRDGHNSAKNTKNKHFLRVDHGGSSRLSKRVHIRRSSSVEIPRPKRFSSGAKELRKERNRKRLGTDTSSGSSKSKKTNSSTTSSVQKHLPKYITNLFRGRMGTDPCKRHTRGSRESSPESPMSGSETVLEFTKKLQNAPPTRRDTMRMAYKQSGKQDSAGTAGSAGCGGEQRTRHVGYSHLPELEVNSASPPRSPLLSVALVAAAVTVEGGSGSFPGATSMAMGQGGVADMRRPSSPPVLPGLPLIEIRRPSALSQFEFGYFVNSPEIVSASRGGSGAGSTDDCAPLLLSGGSTAQICSRKSSDESSMCGWSSRASSRMSQRSSSGGLRLSTFSGGTSIASDNSGPFIFSFVLRKRASTIGTRIPLPKRAISRSSGDSLRVPERELLCGIEMSPDFQCMRQLLFNLLCMYTNKDPNFVNTLRTCSDVLCQVLNTPQHPTVKSWCADILNVINGQLETDAECKLECEERSNDEYLDLQDQIISGSLPCPKEEAALLAAVQLCVEENWPNNKRTQTIRRHLLKGQFGRIRDLAQKIMVTPWEVDQNLYCTPPRALSDSAATNRKMSTNPRTNSHQQDVTDQQGRRRSLTLFSCMSKSEQDPMLSSEVQAQCIPLDFRGDRRTIKLIRERKRKLFHSQLYENEQAMKRLYIQTAKKLPAFGCKVFQVKELLHGHTLRKTVRLLCLSSSTICLLDGCTKLALRRQHSATLQQWRVGGGVSKHQLLLEFRGSKWQLIALSYTTLKSISMTLWEIMQARSTLFVHKIFNRSARPSQSLFEQFNTPGYDQSRSSRNTSYSSSTCSSIRNSAGGFLCDAEPITLFRLELERLQYILHFPEEVAFQLSSTEYQLFYNICALDFVRYVGCDMASISAQDNPSPVKNLPADARRAQKLLVGDYARGGHLVVTLATSTAIEILMGLLKTTKWRGAAHWTPHPTYIEAMQRALRMPQCRVVPFFGTFLYDLYSIVNDLPNILIIGHDGETEKLKFLHDLNGEDHFSSKIGVGGLLNVDKINLVCLILDNLEVFHRHHRNLGNYVQPSDCLANGGFVAANDVSPINANNINNGNNNNSSVPNLNTVLNGAGNAIGINLPSTSNAVHHQPQQQPQMDTGGIGTPKQSTSQQPPEPKLFEPVQQIIGAAHGVTLIPLNTATFDLDMIQRIQHGTTVIHYDPDSGRSVLCRLRLDAACANVVWQRIFYGRDVREKEMIAVAKASANLQAVEAATVNRAQTSLSPRPFGAALVTLDEGFLNTSYIKAIELVDSYDLDIEAIYRRHSVEEMSVPVECWTINFGCSINDNEFLYFLAPQQIAHYWMGLDKVVKRIQDQMRNPDRRVLWLKRLYLQLWSEQEHQRGEVISSSGGSSTGGAPLVAGSSNSPCPPPVCSPSAGPVPASSAADFPSASRRLGPRPVDALQAFGGRVEKWKTLGVSQSAIGPPYSPHGRPIDSSPSTEGGGRSKSRLRQMTIAVTRRVKRSSNSRDCSRSTSPAPQSPMVRPPSIRSQLSSQSGPPGPHSPLPYLLKPRSGFESAAGTALSDAGDLDSLYTPRSRTPTTSSYGGRSVGGRSIKSWRSRGGETPNSGSISSSGGGPMSGALLTTSGKEYQERPITFTEFVELFRLFSTRMRKDLKDLFQDFVIAAHSSANSHVPPKRATSADCKSSCSPRVQSRLESMNSYPTCNEFVPDDILTRNSASHICQLNDKQQKIYNALALASVCSSAPMDTSRNSFLTPAALKQFICTQQMEYVDEQYAQKLIQEHEPDPTFRAKQLLSFEGFVRFLCDPINYAFVPEEIKPSEDQLQHPLSYYYICSSHNTYLIGHQLKGESSTEMYRQVLQTGCRCVELDCWDGDDGLPLIYHGHTLTTKIGFRQVVDVIKASCFGSSDLPVILSIENHCSLQQQSKMAQMFRTAFGDRLVTSFLFDSDYSDCPQLPSPWQLRNKIIIKNKKMIVEPSAGIYTTQIELDIHGPGDLLFGRGGAQMSNLCSEGEIMDIAGSRKGSYESSTIDDVDEDDELDQYLDEEDDDVPTETDVETRTEAGGISPLKMHMIPIIKTSLSSSSNRRPSNESMNSFVSDRTRVVPLSHMAGAISSIASPHASRRILLEGGGGNLCDVERKKSEREFPSLRRHPRGGQHAGLGRRGSNFTTTTAAITRASNNGNQIAPELSDLVIYMQSVKFKGFVVTTLEVPARDTPGTSGTVGGAESVGLSSGELRPCSNSFAGTLRMRSHAPSMLSSYSATVPNGPSTGGTAQPRRLKSSSQTAVSVAEPTNCLQSNTQLSEKNGTDGDIPQPSQQHLQLLPGGTTSMSGGQQHTQTTQNAINSTKNSSSSKGIASPNSKASCYQVSSLTEASARKLCRKHPQKCISYTRNHIMRTYPGGMRIDSSNFNPQQLLEFWQCGLQMVALNYQTADVAMAVNTAMFEQFGSCGYMLKPRALWDASHPLFGKFNPFSKELTLCPALILQLTIISGQYVQNPAGPSFASPFLEIEVIGVPADCAKEKSKMVGRNGVNPVWNHSCTFRIVFAELAFIRVAVCDGAANGRVMAQRVVAVRCLRPGYRHLPLRTPGNQPLEQSFLFVRTRFEQEEHIYLHDEDLLLHFAGGSPFSAQHSPHSACSTSHPLSHHPAHGPSGYESELIYQVLKLESDANVKPLSILRRQIFIIRIIGLLPDDTPTIVHAESSSTVRSIIQMALANAGKAAESADDYVLFEESVQQPLRSPSSDLPLQSIVPPLQNLAADLGGEGTSFAPVAATEVQRMLPHCEPILDAVACWNGSTRRFHLRKRNADASGRAGLFSSIIKSSQPSGALGGAPSASTMSIGPAPSRKSVGHSLAGGDQQQPNKSQSSSQLHGRSIDVVEASGGGGERLEPGMHPRAKSMGETFLVCVHNISDTHPYAILRTSINNTARDIIKQIFAKTQCYDVELDEYALVEEVVVGQQRVEPKSDKGNTKQQAKFRVLEPEENIWKVQSRWSGSSGRFLLERRDQKSNKRVKSPLFYSSMPSCCLMPTINNNMAAPIGTGPSASPILSASASVPSSARPDEGSGGGPLAPLRKISLSSVRSIQIPKLRNARFGKSLTLDGGGQNRHKDSMERN
uniref:Phosphoinositide phospholipase C n=1 Tax=Globodera rostochiensis TaxID=31243 RepID=A0A914I8L9_GLORO